MREGEVVQGRFAVERFAAAGGMGAVYRARDLEDGATVALKVLLGATLHEEEMRFEREARALAGVHHPGIVRYVAHGITAEGLRYLAMEWIDGEDLAARIARGPFSVVDALALGRQLSAALGAAHAHGIVHRDLKPGNVLLAGGDLVAPKIVDFGLAKLPEAIWTSLSGTVVGTPAYMAPEQAHAAPDLDARADVFALGAILYECLSGKPAFDGGNFMATLLKIAFEDVPGLRALGRDVPAALDDLIGRMLAKDPAARPRSGAEVRAALDAIDAANGTVPVSAVKSPAAPALGSGEVRFASFVVAVAPPGSEPDPTATTRQGSGLAPGVRAALRAIEARGGRPAVLADGTIAVAAGGPGLAADHAALAAEHALALRTALPDWAVAVTTGRAEAATDRALGDAIERAIQRIRSRRRSGKAPAIDLDEVTAGMLDPRFVVDAGPLGLELSGTREVSETPRTVLGRATPLVGRDREMAALEALLAECVEERTARAALLTAKAGVGKSRLRHELVRRIQARGDAEVWVARGEPLREAAPFGMLAPAIRRAAHVFDGEPLEDRRNKLLARVSRHVPAPSQARVAEFLGELVGTPFPDDERPELRAARRDPEILADQMRRAWVDFVEAEAQAHPLLLVLEDLHWSDAPSTEYVDAALRRLRDVPLLVLGLARTEVHERFPKLWQERGVLEIALHELSRRASERLVGGVLGERATPELAADLWRRSEGNAFFLEELIRATAALPPADPRGLDLPETVLAMVASRIEGLDPVDRRILRAASVFGEVFWSGGIAALVPDVPDLSRRLGRLEEAEWIGPRPGTRFRGEREHGFGHALVREAAYGMLVDEDRALGHRLAGAWLEAAGEADLALLAEHFHRGREGDKARRFYLAAAERARARHADAEAEILYDKALDEDGPAPWPDEVPAWRGRGLVRARLGRHAEALGDLSHAGGLAQERGDAAAQVEILLDEATALDWMSDFVRSEERVLAARSLLRQDTSPLIRARITLGEGRSAHRFSRNQEAAELLERAAREGEALGEQGDETRIVALLMLGFIYQGLSRLSDSERAIEASLALCEATGDHVHRCGALSNRALFWGYKGDKARQIADTEQVIALARELGQPMSELIAEYNLAETLLLLDDPTLAALHLERAAALDRRLGSGEVRTVVALLQARYSFYQDDEAEVRALLARIRERGSNADVALVPGEEVVWAMLDLATREAQDAEWDALETRGERHLQGYEQVELIEARAIAAQRCGRVDEARRHLGRALALAERVPNAVGPRLRRRLQELS